jgi:hypothetical protein
MRMANNRTALHVPSDIDGPEWSSKVRKGQHLACSEIASTGAPCEAMCMSAINLP